MIDISKKFIANSDEFGMQLTQDVSPILRDIENYKQHNPTRQKGMHLKASFPMVLVKTYMAQKGIDFNEFINNKEHIKNMCSDPALSKFKV